MQVDRLDGPVRHWRYFVPGGVSDWGAIVHLESSGVFLAFSDWGTYGYRWTAPGGTDFREFFLKPEGRTDYFVTKLSAGRRVFDADDTRKAIRARVKELRRSKHITADFARAEWDLAGSFDNEAECLAYWWQKTKLEPEETRSVSVYRACPQTLAFVEHILPRLAVLIAADLERCKAAVMLAMDQAGL